MWVLVNVSWWILCYCFFMFILFGGQACFILNKWNKIGESIIVFELKYCLSQTLWEVLQLFSPSEVDCGILERTRIRLCRYSLRLGHIVGSVNSKLMKLNKLCNYLTIWFMWLWVIAISKFFILFWSQVHWAI